MKRSPIPSILFLFVCVFSFAQSNLYLKVPFDAAVVSNTATEVKFSWNHDGSASYTLEVADNPAFTGASTFPTTAAVTTVPVASLFAGQNHWRVVSGNGNTSVARAFQVVNLAGLGGLLYQVQADEGVIVSSGKVSQWNNQASGLYNASQGVGTLRPDYIASGINNQPVVRFGGAAGTTQQRLNLSSIEIEQSNFAVFFLLKQETVNSALPYVLGYQGNGRVGGIHVRGSAGTYNNFGAVYDNPLVERRPNFVGNFQWAARSISSNQIFFNGTEVSGYTGAGVDGLRFNTIGTRPDATQLNFHGDLAEIVIYNTNLSTANRQTVENYLMSKYTPYPDLGNDMDTCAVSVTLGPINDPAFTSVVWSTGQSGVPTIQATQNGWYWVEAVAFGRTMRDSIFVEGLVPVPQLNITSDMTICAGDAVTLGYTNSLAPDISVLWSDGSTGNSISVDEPGSYSVSFSTPNGCTTESPVRTFDMNYFPLTQGLGEDRTMCLNGELFFEYGTAGEEPYSHVWSDGSTNATLPIVNLGTELYHIAVTDGMGCVALDTVEIELVNVEGPVVSFDFDTVCLFTSNTFTDISVPAAGDNVTEYLWIFPTDSVVGGASATYTPSATAPYPVELQVTTASGCEGRFRDTITMLPQPEVFFNYGTTVCEGTASNFIAGQFSPEQIVSWDWLFEHPSGTPDAASGLVAEYTFQGAGNFSVTLIGTDVNGCTDTLSQVVQVREAPQVDFAFEEVCYGDVVGFSSTSSIGGGLTLTGYSWQFGDGTVSNAQNPNKFYFNPGTYTVTLTVGANNGCSGQETQAIKIHAIPQPGYLTDAVCAGMTAFFTDASLVSAGSVAIVEWSFNGSDPETGFTAEHVFAQTGQNEVTQTVTSGFGCVGINTSTLNLPSFLSADFAVIPGAVLAEYPVVFQNQSVGQTSNQWIIAGGDTLTVFSPETTFPASMIGQEIEVVLIVGNADCSDTLVRTYTVLENRTDLAVNQLFVQEVNGFFIVGAELENRGSTPISRADLFLRTTNTPLIKETWNGFLEAGQKEIHVFTAQPSSVVMAGEQSYVCVEARIVLPAQFTDQDLSNNEQCRLMQDAEAVLLLPYPNPVEEDLTIRFVLPEASTITLQVFDAAGRLVQTIAADQPATKGINVLHANASQWRAGIYTLVLISEGSRITAKVMK